MSDGILLIYFVFGENSIRKFILELGVALEALTLEDKRTPLKVDMLQSFSIKWLVPRLGKFYDDHPEIDVWISTHDELVNFSRDDVEVAIRLGHGDYPELASTLLLQEHVFPVCSPGFLEQHEIINEPGDLLKVPLLLRLGANMTAGHKLILSGDQTPNLGRLRHEVNQARPVFTQLV